MPTSLKTVKLRAPTDTAQLSVRVAEHIERLIFDG